MIRKLATTVAILLVSSVAVAADINVAANTANVPFEFQDASGKLVGFEIDLLNTIGKRLNKSIEFTEMPFNSLFAAVQSGRADIAIGSITITPKRLESVSFTQPFFDANQCLTVGKASGIKGVEGLAGKQVAVVTGTTGEMWATQNDAKYKFGGISRYDDNVSPMLDIATGRIGGLVHDCPIDAYYIKDKPQYAIVATIPTNEQFGLMLRKGSPLLRDVDTAIARLKQDGELARLYTKWFGSSAPTGSSTVTVTQSPQP
ncbi:ABC transporter substrate-binding protein [Paraburkholderia sp. HD33-4]|uniref:ABC transporter substrate-binding protein n=1 Tax=Paraburkholderia sp. HD33-4 TaxID=2883242 RepID=UPI001F20B3D8|nr:ABC transporter substrate-binding protein [Paraburkholderia sp. HD33-4]